MLSGLSARIIIILILSYLAPLNVLKAEVIQLTLNNGLIATAEFHQGEPEAPAILLLHGFLQTRQAQTVGRIYTALAEGGHTVLAPTLSLGVSKRKQSLACEAIHSHTMQSDIAELELWSRWLFNKAGKKISLIGHSAGSVHHLAYLDKYSYEHIRNGIFISLGYFGTAPGSNETEQDGQRAEALLRKGDTGLNKYGLTYCKEYVTTAKNYLTYFSWKPDKILTTLKKTNIPIAVIIGTKDARIGKSWGKTMKDNGINIKSVTGAGHFFDQEYEFDLQDEIESSLK